MSAHRPADAARPAGATATRHVALLILDAVLAGGRTLDAAWGGQSRRLEGMSARDRAFARLLVTMALRRLGEIDHLLAGLLERPLPDRHAIVRQILRLGVVQLRFLGTPPHAAIDQAVRLARAVDRAGMAGLVNAVLRKVPGLPSIAAEEAAVLNTPDWLLQAWTDAHGAPVARAIGLAHLEEPPLDLSVRDDAAAWAETLGGELLPTGSVRLSRAGDITALPGYADGAWWVQDAAAALLARLLAPAPGTVVLDLCAAPGGKTAQLAAAGARVTAVEIEPRRAALLGENLARLHLAAEVAVADAAAYDPPTRPDAILLDAPCSATGTLRRHPDVARLKTPDDPRRMTPVQDRLLAHAASLLAPGGRLVYAVCSLQPEEGPQRIAALLARSGAIARDPVRPEELPGLETAVTAEGDVMTLPSMWPERGHLDGFYIARLVKRAA